MTHAERKRLERERRRAGLVLMEFWVHALDVDAINREVINIQAMCPKEPLTASSMQRVLAGFQTRQSKT